MSAFKLYQEELNKGYSYVYKRDNSFRPIFIINVAKLKKLKVSTDLVVHMSTFMIQFLSTRALIPGKVENWITIMDMKNVGLTEVPKKLLKALSKPLQTYFKGRLYRLHIINA